MKLQKKDISLLKYLRNNSRATLTEISRHTKIPISTLYDRLKMHEKGLILKHTTLIDFSKMGYNTKVQLLLKAPREQKERLRSFLTYDDRINSVFRTTNDYDFIAEGLFTQPREVQKFIDSIEKEFELQNINTLFVVEDLKREGFGS